ncbi:MAG: YitT family protein [Prevotellaceae bacterium]|nr:YitT family protein [Prevotellaceae bacterium]
MMFILMGISMYSFGFTAFILPEKIVMGGVAGLSALIYYAFEIPPAISLWVINVVLLALAFKALNRQFTIRTIIGVTLMSTIIGIMQPFFQLYPVITAGEDKFMHVLIGAVLCGAALGIVFAHNGSTGGTDIIMAILNKYFRMSFGRAMQLIDIIIIGSSYILFKSTEVIVYGVIFTLFAGYVCDYIVNGTRQTVQFIIISKEYERIADMINNDLHRGVTLLDGKGWYSKQGVKILLLLARKYESQDVFRHIKQIDPEALVSQSQCHGVFGKGFDNFN